MIHAMYEEPLSPLTSPPPSTPANHTPSSPWPTPCHTRIPMRTFHHSIHAEKSLRKVETYRIVQTPFWHISQAKCQNTVYRGKNSPCSTRIIFPENSSAEERLKILKENSYRIIEYHRWVEFICCILQETKCKVSAMEKKHSSSTQEEPALVAWYLQ